MALVALVCRFCLALLLGTAGLAKIASTDEFAESVSAFGVANRRRGRIVAVWLLVSSLAGLLVGALTVSVVRVRSAATRLLAKGVGAS